MTTSVRLVRDGVVMELHRRAFRVLLDGEDAGSIESHQTFEREVEPGRHTLQVRTGRFSSARHPFDAADGQIVRFRCWGGRIWPVYLVSLIKTDLALVLRKADPASTTSGVDR